MNMKYIATFSVLGLAALCMATPGTALAEITIGYPTINPIESPTLGGPGHDHDYDKHDKHDKKDNMGGDMHCDHGKDHVRQPVAVPLPPAAAIFPLGVVAAALARRRMMRIA